MNRSITPFLSHRDAVATYTSHLPLPLSYTVCVHTYMWPLNVKGIAEIEAQTMTRGLLTWMPTCMNRSVSLPLSPSLSYSSMPISLIYIYTNHDSLSILPSVCVYMYNRPQMLHQCEV